jgi:hypothetical protein
MSFSAADRILGQATPIDVHQDVTAVSTMDT